MAASNYLTRRSSRKERQEVLKEWMDDFQQLMEKATPIDTEESVDHYLVFFENKEPTFDMDTRNFSFPKSKDPRCIDAAKHTVDSETMLTDPVFELAYDYFLKGHPLRFMKCQGVPGVVGRFQRLFDYGGVDYDKTMIFGLRYQGQIWRWESKHYLSRLKYIVDPERKSTFPSLRDIVARTWPKRFPEDIKSSCFSLIQECMIPDYEHSMYRMRPGLDRQLVQRFARAGLTDVTDYRVWNLDITVDFVPSELRRRQVAGIYYDVSLEFHASFTLHRRRPYENFVEDTDVEDND